MTPDASAYLRSAFALDVETHVFTDEELSRLRTYGAWLDALASGALAPRTEAQRQFVAGVQAEEPTGEWARLWLKYVARKEYEELRQSTPRYRVTDGAEDWFPRETWRRGVHFPRRARR